VAASAKSGPNLPRIPRPGRLAELYAELCALPNVRGCFVGHKRRKGRSTREVSIICCVVDKPRPRELRKAQRIPSAMEWRISSQRTGTIRTDVQVLGETALHAAVLGAGDEVDGFTPFGGVPQPGRGTIGVAMRHPEYGPVVTTAGHVLGAESFGVTTFPPGREPRVALRNAGQSSVVYGVARKVAITPESDYALISAPAGQRIENLFQDDQPLAVPYAPQPSDIARPAFVLTSQGIVPTRLRGIHGSLPVGQLMLRDLLLTDFRTQGGDSGGCLVNSDSRVMGLVEGVTSADGHLYSAFTSVAWPFVFEQGVFF
jgi:hypothetical protein